jgi:sulfopyruvate decarboxylase alpha subunit
VYVPDNPLSHVLRELRDNYPDVETTIATREEEAFGIAAGLYLGGKRPTVMLQSSGLGNSLNALTSLFVPYQIPALILISMRGDANEWNAAQVPMGRAVAPILDAIEIPNVPAASAESVADTVALVGKTAFATRRAGACLLPRRITVPRAEGDRMTRLDATRSMTSWFGDRAVVASLGHPAYDLFAAGDRPANFYTWGSMGLASSIGLGLAMAQPEKRVVVLDGDGSLLMNLGSLATIGWVQPKNLVVIVWDNGVYGTTGGQDTATVHGTNLAGAATAMGISNVATAETIDGLARVLDRVDAEPGPWVVVVKVTENMPAVKPPLDCVYIKQRFMAAIGSPEAATIGGSA